MRVLVCGGRRYSGVEHVFGALDIINRSKPITLLIQGGAAGVDFIARRWAAQRCVPLLTVFAQWDLGPSAGPLRNAAMLDRWQPECVVAFPGGRGTADMSRRAERAGHLVLRP